MYSNEDQYVETLVSRKSRPYEEATRTPPASDSIIRELRQTLRETKVRLNDQSLYALEMNKDYYNPDFLEKVKSDNVLLYQTNQDLRVIINELQKKLKTLEIETSTREPVNNAEFIREIEGLKAKNGALERQLSDMSREMADKIYRSQNQEPELLEEIRRQQEELMMISNEKVMIERERLEDSRRITSLEKERASMMAELEQLRRNQNPLETSVSAANKDSNFFFTKADIAEENNAIRSELSFLKEKCSLLEQTLRKEVGERDSRILSLESRLASTSASTPDLSALSREVHFLRETNRTLAIEHESAARANRELLSRVQLLEVQLNEARTKTVIRHVESPGVISMVDIEGMSELEALRADNKALRENISAITKMNHKNLSQIEKMGALSSSLISGGVVHI